MSELKYIFGPVPSRRLGRSLGINVVPSKICSLDCLYCEVGKTKALTMERKPYYKADKIIQELSSNIHNFDNMFDVVTITGAGEPTLNSQLHDILKRVKEVTNKPVAILTNTTTIYMDDVYNTLLDFDIVVPSLDGAEISAFEKINLPEKSIELNKIINSLTKFSHEYKGKLFVEMLFCKNINDSHENISELVTVLKNIKADKVQLGTIHRPPSYKDTVGVDDEFLLETAKYFIKNNIKAEVCSGFNQVYSNSKSLLLIDLIPSLLKMRPCTIMDMAGVFGKDIYEIEKTLNILLEKNIITKEVYNNDTYFKKA